MRITRNKKSPMEEIAELSNRGLAAKKEIEEAETKLADVRGKIIPLMRKHIEPEYEGTKESFVFDNGIARTIFTLSEKSNLDADALLKALPKEIVEQVTVNVIDKKKLARAIAEKKIPKALVDKFTTQLEPSEYFSLKPSKGA